MDLRKSLNALSTTRRHTPEDLNPQQHRRENLKYYTEQNITSKADHCYVCAKFSCLFTTN